MNKIISLLLTGIFLLIAQPGNTYEIDAAQAKLKATNEANWKRQDREIDQQLRSMERQSGKPNIIFILSDDIGWGELGSYGGGKLRGTPTPHLDELAKDGMRFLQHYSEPSCTVTRVTLMTGRLPVRNGVDVVLFPGNPNGLVDEEVTLAELLKTGGYATAMFGKWHLGEALESQPTNQGFDYAFYTKYNGGAWPWMDNVGYFDPENEVIGEIPYQLDMPKDYEEVFGITIQGIHESRRNETPKEVADLSLERYNRHDDELTDKILDYIDEQSQEVNPFFVYFATNAQQVFSCPPAERNEKYVDSANCQAAQLAQHDKNVKRIRDKLEALDIDDNTLLLWVSDNGPMYSFYPSAGFSYLKGKKHEVKEGGVRTPAIAYWPGQIEAGQDPIDIFHISDWFTTLARIAGVEDEIPDDRIIDGVDQTAMILKGEGFSRRDYLFLYRYSIFGTGLGTHLKAIRWRNIKFYPNELQVFNIMRDPNEEYSNRSQYLWAMEPMRQMIVEHQKLMHKFPNRKRQE